MDHRARAVERLGLTETAEPSLTGLSRDSAAFVGDVHIVAEIPMH